MMRKTAGEASITSNVVLMGCAGGAAGLATALLWRRRAIDLNGKVVLITGGSRGLGLALARGFAKHGSRLVLCARDEAELDRAKQDIANLGADVITLRCDVTDRAQVQRTIDLALQHYGRID